MSDTTARIQNKFTNYEVAKEKLEYAAQGFFCEKVLQLRKCKINSSGTTIQYLAIRKDDLPTLLQGLERVFGVKLVEKEKDNA